MGHHGGFFSLWDLSDHRNFLRIDLYQGVATGNINDIIQTQNEFDLEFAAATENGCCFIVCKKDRMFQKVSEDILLETPCSTVMNFSE